MKIIVEEAITRAERAAVARIRQQVFEREMGMALKPLSEFDRGSHLLARIEPNQYPVGALSVIDTSGDHDLHKSFGLGFGRQTRAARLSHLAVLAPYRRMNIPLMLMLHAFREIIGPGGFDHTWLLFDTQRVASSALVNLLGFIPTRHGFDSEYGNRSALVRNEKAARTLNATQAAEEYVEQSRGLRLLVQPTPQSTFAVRA
jgi:ribosomal protein S18 acetylase RimI-like enzyme